MIWHVQQNVVKCFIIPLPRFSYIYIYWLIHFKKRMTKSMLNFFKKWQILPVNKCKGTNNGNASFCGTYTLSTLEPFITSSTTCMTVPLNKHNEMKTFAE